MNNRFLLIPVWFMGCIGCVGAEQVDMGTGGLTATGGTDATGGTGATGGADATGGAGATDATGGLGGDDVQLRVVDKVDLLVVIDSSPSMMDEQQKLRAELPALVRALATGIRSDGSTFRSVRDINLGVVTTNMGLPGIPEAPAPWNCNGFGDDGLLRTSPSGAWSSPAGEQPWAPDAQCAATYPKFINFRAGEDPGGAERVTSDFGCLLQVGPGGCGFEMQLEAGLKALTPSLAPSDRVENLPVFLSDGTGDGTQGHGDGPNAGFLRNDETAGQSLIAVLLITDEEDCSSHTIEHLRPLETAQPPYNDDQYNLRCANFSNNLWGIERYVQGLKALRPGHENLVVFAAITGVPENLVSPKKTANVDFSDSSKSDAFYDNILANPNMELRIGSSGRNLANACGTLGDAGGAKPARRIIEVVKGFGQNGVLGSICDSSFSGSLDRIVDVISKELGEAL